MARRTVAVSGVARPVTEQEGVPLSPRGPVVPETAPATSELKGKIPAVGTAEPGRAQPLEPKKEASTKAPTRKADRRDKLQAEAQLLVSVLFAKRRTVRHGETRIPGGPEEATLVQAGECDDLFLSARAKVRSG